MIMTSAPAPVAATRPIVAATVTKRTGLIGMRPGSDHMVTLARGTPDERGVVVRARPSEEGAVVDAAYVCLHPTCSGKSWPGLRELHEGHPAPSQMARDEAIHVYGLWSDVPVDPKAIAPLKATAVKAEKRAVDAQEAADKDGGLNDVAEARAKKARKLADDAARALADASAPVGLIAPPELTVASL